MKRQCSMLLGIKGMLSQKKLKFQKKIFEVKFYNKGNIGTITNFEVWTTNPG